MSYSKKQLAGTLLLIRKSNGKGIIGNWSVCSFELPNSNITEVQLLAAFSEEINCYYLGDADIASVIFEGKYNPIIFFLIPSKHVEEIGKHIYTFPVLSE